MSYIVKNTVNRSRSLKCYKCKTPLPMGSPANFMLSDSHVYEAVYCNQCVYDDSDLEGMVAEPIQDHTFDLSDSQDTW